MVGRQICTDAALSHSLLLAVLKELSLEDLFHVTDPARELSEVNGELWRNGKTTQAHNNNTQAGKPSKLVNSLQHASSRESELTQQTVQAWAESASYKGGSAPIR